MLPIGKEDHANVIVHDINYAIPSSRGSIEHTVINQSAPKSASPGARHICIDLVDQSIGDPRHFAWCEHPCQKPGNVKPKGAV